MKVRELVTVLGFEIENQKLEQLDSAIDKVKVGLAGLTALTVGAGAALFGLVKTSANAADEIKKVALAAGVGMVEIQELGYAAQISGASMEELGVGLKFLSKNMYEASKTPKGEMAQAFSKLGVSVVDTTGKLKSSGVVLKELSDKFKAIDNPTQKAAMAMQFFGRSGGNLIEFLNKGSASINELTKEFQAFALSDEAVETLGDFNDALDKTLAFLGAIKNFVAAAVAPELTQMLDVFREWIYANREILKSGLVDFFKGLAGYLYIIFRITLSVASAFIWLADKIGGVEAVTKALLLIMTALFGALTVSGIMGVVAALKVLAVILGVTVAQALLIPLAIAAAIGAIFLIVDDLVAYFEGRDSVTAIIVEKFKSAFETIKGYWDNFKNWIIGGADTILEKIGKLVQAFHPLSNLWSLVNGEGLPAWQFIKGMGTQETAGTFVKPPMSAPRPYAGELAGPTNVLTQQNQITVHAGGADPSTIGDRVEKGTETSLQELFRRAGHATAPAKRK